MKKRGRGLLVVLSSVFISTMFTGCNEEIVRGNEKSKEIKVGVSVYEKSDVFISGIVDSIKNTSNGKDVKENYTFNISVEDANGSQYSQNEQVDQFIAEDFDVLCINLVDRRSASFIINKAKSSNIPVVFFNREPVEEDMNMWEKVYYVGAQAEQSGIMQGDILLDIYNKDKNKVDKNKDGKIQYVMLEGERGHQDAEIRTEYSINRIINSGIKVEKLDSDSGNWNRDEGREKMKSWIHKYGDEIEVIFSNNDDMALGAIDQIKVSSLKNKIPIIIGVDGIDEAVHAIKKGEMTGTVISDWKIQGEEIFNIIYGLTTDNKEEVNLNRKYIRSPHKIVTSENVDDFIE